MKKTNIAVLALVAALGATPAVLTAAPTTRSAEQAQLQKEAKISMKQATAIALRQVRSGKVESAELEREGGHLIYSFDIRQPKRSGITEVNVNAMNGKVLAVQHENPAKEAAEAKQEAQQEAQQKH